MSDYSWTIETGNNGNVIADAVEADTYPTFTVSEEVTFRFIFYENNRTTDHVTRYETLRDYAEWLTDENVDVGTDMRGKPWYRFRMHPDAPITSPAVKVVPGADIQSTQPYWMIITDGTDETRNIGPGAGETLELTCTVLARGSRYSSRSDMASDLKAEE